MNSRAQGAIEFITTYGWAIIAVVVAIGVLYSLGIFSFGSSGGTGCVVIAGFSCTKPILYSSGALAVGLGQIGSSKTITAVGCSKNATAPTVWEGTGITLSSGQVGNFTFNCPGVQGSALGTVYQATLWIKYVSGGGGGGTVTQEVGTVKAAVQGLGVPNLPAGSYFVPITLNNAQPNGTGSNFQQQINVSTAQYSQYLSSNLGNIRFYQGGTELYSWCESGCSKGSLAMFWVLLPSGIPAGSNMIVYMALENSVTVGYDGVYAGEAPQLTCSNPLAPATCSAGSGVSGIYGQYDNGREVFNYYTNFTGSGVPSGWTKTGNVIISNGITVTSPNTGSYAISQLWENSFGVGPQFPNPGVIDTYASFAYTGNVLQVVVANFGGTNESSGRNFGTGVLGGAAFGTGLYTGASYYGPQSFSPQPGAGMHVWSTLSSSTITSEYDYNSGSAVAFGAADAYSYGELQFDSALSTGGASVQATAFTVAQWIRMRAYPPNGVMPGYAFGSVGS